VALHSKHDGRVYVELEGKGMLNKKTPLKGLQLFFLSISGVFLLRFGNISYLCRQETKKDKYFILSYSRAI